MKDKITTIILDNSTQNFQEITLVPTPSSNKKIHNFKLSSPNLENDLSVQVQEQNSAQKAYDCQKTYYEKLSSVYTPKALELIHHPLGSILISSASKCGKSLEEAVIDGSITTQAAEKILAETSEEMIEIKWDTRPALANASLLDHISGNTFLSEADKLVLIKRYIEDFTQPKQWNLLPSPNLAQAITFENGKFYLSDFSQAYYSDHIWLDILIANKTTQINNNFWANSWPQKNSLLTEICTEILQGKDSPSPITTGNQQFVAEFVQSYVKLLHDRGDLKHKSQITLSAGNEDTFRGQEPSSSSLSFNSIKQLHHLSVNDKKSKTQCIQPLDCPGCLTLKKMTLRWSDGSSTDYDYREFSAADFSSAQDAFFIPSRHGLVIISTSTKPYFFLERLEKAGCELNEIVLETAQFTHFIQPEIISSLLPLLKYDAEQGSAKDRLIQEIAILQDSISDWKFKYNSLLERTHNNSDSSIAMCNQLQNAIDQIQNSTSWKVTKPFRSICNALKK